MTRSFDADDAENAPLLVSSESSAAPRARAQCYGRGSQNCEFVVGLLLIVLISTATLSFLISPSGPKEFPPNGPGIGIALSTDYNTISIRQDHSEASTVATIPAIKKYSDLIRRLSLSSSQHPTPPYNSFSELMSDRPRQWRRRLRKKLGWPASADVGILAETMRELITAVEHALPPSQLPLTSAIVALPNAIALYPEDSQDALEYLGLQALRGHNVYAALRALPAAYAGYGIGLCAHPEDFKLCLEEEKEMLWRGAMAVDLNRASLGVDASWMGTPMYAFNEDMALLDWQAGLPNGEPNEIYWQRVRDHIRHAVPGLVSRSGKPQGEKYVYDVLMVGDMGGDERLIDIVREIVAKVQEEDAVIWSGNPQFIVAQGAAELAKRLLLQGGGFR